MIVSYIEVCLQEFLFAFYFHIRASFGIYIHLTYFVAWITLKWGRLTCFVDSVSLNFGFLRQFVTFMGKNCICFFTPFVPFIVLNARFQWKNPFEKQPSLGQDVWEDPMLVGGLVWSAMIKSIFVNFSAQGGWFCVEILVSKWLFWVQ